MSEKWTKEEKDEEGERKTMVYSERNMRIKKKIANVSKLIIFFIVP